MDAACLPAARVLLAAVLPPPLAERLRRWDELDEDAAAGLRAELDALAALLGNVKEGPRPSSPGAAPHDGT